jgi:hypothetical protein
MTSRLGIPHPCRGPLSDHLLWASGNNLAGMSRPSALAALRLITSSKLVAGFLALENSPDIDASLAILLLTAASVTDRHQPRQMSAPAAPHRGNEIVLADDVFAVLHQVNQQVEHLRLDRNRLGIAGQLAPVDIQRLVMEIE